MENKITQDMLNELYKSFIALDNDEECKMFFEDLLTTGEVEQFAQRLRAAKLLLQGKTYSQIIEETDISSATLSRVSNCVRRGKGGYKKIIAKMNKND